jgi:hypothetical protein
MNLFTPRRNTVLALAVATAGLAAFAAVPGPARAESAQGGPATRAAPFEVLTLDEAATLLRVEPRDLRNLALLGRVPGRKLGSEWRFSRRVLLLWLAGTEPPDPELLDEQLASLMDRDLRGGDGDPAGTEASDTELAAILGRGPEDGSGGEATVGEPPQAKTAEEIFLRNQRVLLGRGELIIEPSLYYSRSDRPAIKLLELVGPDDGVPGLPDGLILPASATIEKDTFSISTAFRYGLFGETEVFAGGRYQHLRLDPGSEFSSSRTHSGGVFLGVRRTLLRESRYIPDLVFSLRGNIPIAKDSYAVGSDMWLVKSFDPIVLFGGVEYRHTFSRNFDELELLEPEDTLGLTFGSSFAVNDTLSLNTSLSALFNWETDFGDVILRQQEEFSLRMGLTWTGGTGPYLEPNVTLGLNGPGNWVTFGLSIPWRVIE